MFRWALSRSGLEYLFDSPNGHVERQEQGQDTLFENTFMSSPAIPPQWIEPSDFPWDSAFLSNSGIPD
jgi:hypothetical protein